MAERLTQDDRRRILDFVRPLSVALDGETNYGFVERRLRICRRLVKASRELEPGLTHDEERLFLLAAFAGLPGGRFSEGGRAELLLRGAGLSRREISGLFRALRRLDKASAKSPRSAPFESFEEAVVHDATALETVGAYGVTRALVAGARERMTLFEMAREIEERMAAVEFATGAGRALAAARLELARGFAKSLAAEAAEFEEPTGEGSGAVSTPRGDDRPATVGVV